MDTDLKNDIKVEKVVLRKDKRINGNKRGIVMTKVLSMCIYTDICAKHHSDPIIFYD